MQKSWTIWEGKKSSQQSELKLTAPMELLIHMSHVLSVHRSSSKEEALFDETMGHIQDILLGGW